MLKNSYESETDDILQDGSLQKSRNTKRPESSSNRLKYSTSQDENRVSENIGELRVNSKSQRRENDKLREVMKISEKFVDDLLEKEPNVLRNEDIYSDDNLSFDNIRNNFFLEDEVLESFIDDILGKQSHFLEMEKYLSDRKQIAKSSFKKMTSVGIPLSKEHQPKADSAVQINNKGVNFDLGNKTKQRKLEKWKNEQNDEDLRFLGKSNFVHSENNPSFKRTVGKESYSLKGSKAQNSNKSIKSKENTKFLLNANERRALPTSHPKNFNFLDYNSADSQNTCDFRTNISSKTFLVYQVSDIVPENRETIKEGDNQEQLVKGVTNNEEEINRNAANDYNKNKTEGIVDNFNKDDIREEQIENEKESISNDFKFQHLDAEESHKEKNDDLDIPAHKLAESSEELTETEISLLDEYRSNDTHSVSNSAVMESSEVETGGFENQLGLTEDAENENPGVSKPVGAPISEDSNLRKISTAEFPVKINLSKKLSKAGCFDAPRRTSNAVIIGKTAPVGEVMIQKRKSVVQIKDIPTPSKETLSAKSLAPLTSSKTLRASACSFKELPVSKILQESHHSMILAQKQSFKETEVSNYYERPSVTKDLKGTYGIDIDRADHTGVSKSYSHLREQYEYPRRRAFSVAEKELKEFEKEKIKKEDYEESGYYVPRHKGKTFGTVSPQIPAEEGNRYKRAEEESAKPFDGKVNEDLQEKVAKPPEPKEANYGERKSRENSVLPEKYTTSYDLKLSSTKRGEKSSELRMPSKKGSLLDDHRLQSRSSETVKKTVAHSKDKELSTVQEEVFEMKEGGIDEKAGFGLGPNESSDLTQYPSLGTLIPRIAETRTTSTQQLEKDISLMTMKARNIKRRRPLRTISAVATVGGVEVKTCYTFSDEAETIEVYTNGKLRVRVSRSEQQDVYSNDMKNSDMLPLRASVSATTLIAANNCQIKTVVTRHGNRESVQVFKNDVLLCKVGNTDLRQ